MLQVEGHAIVSADGMIADRSGEVPVSLRNAADWRQYQAALDQAAIIVTGRGGHERFPNPGRRRLVLTRRVSVLTTDSADPLATLWNPETLPFDEALTVLGVEDGVLAITGVFELFAPLFTSFQLSESHRLVVRDGTPCFAAGHPRAVLAAAGLLPGPLVMLDPAAEVSSTRWERNAA